MAELQNVCDAEFSAEVLQAAEPVLVDFWAPWCTNCSALAPILEQIAEEDNLRIVKVDIEKNSEAMTRYRISSLPTMILFDRGAQIKKIIGAVPKQDIKRKIKSALGKEND